MTKKMEKINERFIEKMEMQVTLFEMEVIDRESCSESLREFANEYDYMITSMFHYDLISKNDFMENVNTASNTFISFIEVL